MKSYKQFVSETYTAQERLDEVLGLRLLGKGISLLGKGAYHAGKQTLVRRSIRGAAGGIGAGRALDDKNMSDKDKAYSAVTGAASVLPVVGPAAFGLHLGDYLRSKKFGKDAQWLKKTLGFTDEKESK